MLSRQLRQKLRSIEQGNDSITITLGLHVESNNSKLVKKKMRLTVDFNSFRKSK